MEFRKWFSSKFKELRNKEGMTQREFAEISGIGSATIERIESGTTGLSIATCLLIAQTLGVSLSELFDGYS